MHETTVWQKFDSQARRGVPICITLFLLLFSMVPMHMPGVPALAPMYTLMAVYFWSVYRPDGFGYGAAFSVGVMEDLLVGTPLGSTALVLLVCQWVVLNQQKFFNNRPFLEVWLAFAVIAVGTGVLRWLCAGVIGTGDFSPFSDTAGSILLTIVIYPVIGWLLAWAQMKLMAQP
jgi:rod shape-determining protein MreD